MTTETVHLLAGTYNAGFQNGPAPLGASFSEPIGLAYDAASGMVYIADTGNNVIRSLNLVSGNVSTFAGSGVSGFLDGPALQAQFSSPSGISLDQSTGNIYIADTYNYRIRLLNVTSGDISTIAGNGMFGFSDGPALQAELGIAFGIAFESSNGIIFFTDQGNNRVRIVNMASGTVSTIAGTGTPGFLDGPASQAEFNVPVGIAFDTSYGNVMVADSANSRIRLFNIFTNNVSTIAGN